MDRRRVAAGSLALALLACDSSREKAVQQISHDQAILKRAGAAANEVIRSSTDCAVAAPLIAEAYERIEEARGQVTAPASQATLGALQAQVDRVASACP